MPRLSISVQVLAIIVLLSACSAPLQVDRLTDQSLANEPKVLALLTRSVYDADVRRYLARNGFRVKRYATTTEVEDRVSPTRTETYNEGETRFGLSVYPGSRVDYCVVSDGIQLGRAVFEVSDLVTNEVVLFVEAGGWTSPCAYHRDIVWDKLASALAEEWR